MSEPEKDVKDYLARIRKTIADSEHVISQAELRIAETDRTLEQHGLTREQVMAMRFSDAQMEAINAELKRRGLDALEKWSEAEDQESQPPEIPTSTPSAYEGPSDELENRQRKFGMMMKPFQI